MKKPIPEGQIEGVTWEQSGDVVTFTFPAVGDTPGQVVPVAVVGGQLDLYPDRSSGQKRVLALLP